MMGFVIWILKYGNFLFLYLIYRNNKKDIKMRLIND